MNTLIELYGERAIENIIGPETFKPGHVVYLCTKEVLDDSRNKEILEQFFRERGDHTEVSFVECSMYKTSKILATLRKIAKAHPDCVIDVTGGTDAILFAVGMFCQETGTPAFTYSRRGNVFYNIHNAEFAEKLPCNLTYGVEEFFHMTGGTLRKGRVDNSILESYMKYFHGFFQIFLHHRRNWTENITFFQRISQGPKDGPVNLKVHGLREQKGEHGSRVFANEVLLKELLELGFIRNLDLSQEEKVSFVFKDEWTRSWLRDVGSVLELYVYKVCRDTGIFQDVVSSAVVDWDGTVGHDSVSNEIDAVAARGTLPVFISCKATEVKTEALNELAILRDRFGGKGAKAIIVTTENCNAAARHRAAQLGIAVIDQEELLEEKMAERMKIIMKA